MVPLFRSIGGLSELTSAVCHDSVHDVLFPWIPYYHFYYNHGRFFLFQIHLIESQFHVRNYFYFTTEKNYSIQEKYS